MTSDPAPALCRACGHGEMMHNETKVKCLAAEYDDDTGDYRDCDCQRFQGSPIEPPDPVVALDLLRRIRASANDGIAYVPNPLWVEVEALLAGRTWTSRPAVDPADDKGEGGRVDS